MAHPLTVRAILCWLALHTANLRAEDAPQIAADKQALSALQAYVGQWRGVGQLRRGSSRGAWTEACDWSWHFHDGRAELVGDVSDAHYFSQLRIQPGAAKGQFTLVATPIDADRKQPRKFAGTLAEGVLTLTAAEAGPEQPARVTVRLVAHGDRMVVLYEKRVGDDLYSRLAEVGSTRQGSSFAKTAASGPECVVTGGLGTIAVEFEGKKYFVCCTGCRDLFNDDPAGVLAEYRRRKAEEKQGK